MLNIEMFYKFQEVVGSELKEEYEGFFDFKLDKLGIVMYRVRIYEYDENLSRRCKFLVLLNIQGLQRKLWIKIGNIV